MNRCAAGSPPGFDGSSALPVVAGTGQRGSELHRPLLLDQRREEALHRLDSIAKVDAQLTFA